MASHQKINFRLGGRKAFLVVLLGLAALLPNLLLPLVFYVHLLAAPLPAPGQLADACPRISGAAQSAAQPWHDPGSCPICRAADNFQDYAASPALLPPHLSWPPRIHSLCELQIQHKDLCCSVSDSRAPPSFL